MDSAERHAEMQAFIEPGTNRPSRRALGFKHEETDYFANGVRQTL